MTHAAYDRYERQIALPEIGLAGQKKLHAAHIAVIGAGGLGAAALPYLAGAGIGNITVYDHDTVSPHNLHRQTIYQDAQTGQNKAEAAAKYLTALNPDIKVTAITKHFDETTNLPDNLDLILDSSDNFATKSLLNEASLRHHVPLISASVQGFKGQTGIFAGYYENVPCYHCLFPELPENACNCNDAGILGTSAGLTGLYQAHLALGYILGFKNMRAGCILSFDFKALRMQRLELRKNPACPVCKDIDHHEEQPLNESPMPKIMRLEDLQGRDFIVVDVRTQDEINSDPLYTKDNIIYMELGAVRRRFNELPKDKLLAFLCAGNVRSAQAASWMKSMGYDQVCILDRYSL
ncbi:MAG: HesA/MoeB/ThiF family protein [Alphaproteobacteria bacterium]|nr:HesA/MoeB/ThiF family protein [Alphaproteobacteria bacterium]